MKNLFLIIAIAMMSITTSNAQSAVTQWKASDCYQGIEWRVHYSQNSNGTYNGNIEFKNRYTNAVKFMYDLKGGTYESKNNGKHMNSGETQKSYATGFTSTNFQVRVYNGTRTGITGYVDCDTNVSYN